MRRDFLVDFNVRPNFFYLVTRFGGSCLDKQETSTGPTVLGRTGRTVRGPGYGGQLRE